MKLLNNNRNIFTPRNIISTITIIILYIFELYYTEQARDIFRAVGLMTCGFAILAGFYYITNNNWNGYAQFKKLEVIFAMFIAISILLVTVPETSAILKALGITMDTEGTGKVLYIIIGVYISKIVENKIGTTNTLSNNTCDVNGCLYMKNLNNTQEPINNLE